MNNICIYMYVAIHSKFLKQHVDMVKKRMFNQLSDRFLHIERTTRYVWVCKNESVGQLYTHLTCVSLQRSWMLHKKKGFQVWRLEPQIYFRHGNSRSVTIPLHREFVRNFFSRWITGSQDSQMHTTWRKVPQHPTSHPRLQREVAAVPAKVSAVLLCLRRHRHRVAASETP